MNEGWIDRAGESSAGVSTETRPIPRARVTRARVGIGLLVACLLFVAYFWGLAVATTTSSYAWPDLVMLLVAYALLSAAVGATAVAAAQQGRILGFLGSLPLAAALLWHLLEQTDTHPRRWLSVLATLALAAGCSIAMRRLVPKGSVHRMGAALAACGLGVLFVLATSGFYLSSNTFRWHLLRHNKLVGTPAYYLLSVPVHAIAEAEWKAHFQPQLVAEAPHALPRDAGIETVPDRPNIVFVILDTLRADQLAAYGGSPEIMPNLNRLAERSHVFSDVLVNATWTRPSVASIFTGLPQEIHGAMDRHDALPSKQFTLAEALQGIGFETAAFVSNFGAVGRAAGFAQGFDHFEEVKVEHAAYARAEVVNQAVASWLEGRRDAGGDAPVFLYVHYLDPHTPYVTCEGVCPTSTHAEALDSYQRQLHYLDTHLRWLIEDLPRALPGRTVMLFTSDHGEEFGEHDEGGHGHSLYREVLHVPAVLWMGAPGGSRIDTKLAARDFFDLIGRIGTDPGLDVGRWASERARRVRYASLDSSSLSSLHRPYQGRIYMRALEREDLVLIWSAYGDTHELYDIAADPAQRSNLARGREDDVESLTRAMEDLIPRWAERVPVSLDDETVKALRALGYIR